MKKVFLLLILITKIVISQDYYMPKNDKEKEYLEDLRGNKITLGLDNTDFMTEVIGGESLNSILEDMLSNYLQLNVEVIEGSWDSIYSKFSKGEIDSVGFITRSRDRGENAEFSVPILSESLYAASENKRITRYDDLNGKDVYIYKNSIYINFFNDFLESRNIDAKIVPVDSLKNIEDEVVLESTFEVMNFKYSVELMKLPDQSFAVLKKNIDLIPIVNNAIKEKYSDKIDRFLIKRKNKKFNERFIPTLTDEEKRYLKTIDSLKIVYEDIGDYSYPSDKNGIHKGMLPDIVRTLGERVGLNIEEFSKNTREWNKNLIDFEDGKIDIIPISKNKDREQKYLFTNSILELPLYKLTCLNPVSENKVGVMANSIDELTAKKYYLEDQTISYYNYDEMIEGFKNHEIDSIISLDIKKLKNLEYGLDVIEYIPVNLAVKKEDKILRDILDKGISKMFDKNDIIKKSELERKIHLKNSLEKTDKMHRSGMGLLSLLIGALLTLIYRTFKMKKERNEFLKDPLTGLLSRFSYNEFCIEKNEKKGTAILIDLNNFKQLNDEYGHDFGDMILSEVGNILKKVFIDDFIFRISGDEFHIFSSDSQIRKKMNNLNSLVINSIRLRKYGINLSLGYYEKKSNKNMNDAFKYADMAMYKAKRGRCFSEEATDEFIDEIRRVENIRKFLNDSIEDEVYAVFQPKYNLETLDLIGGEALARWENSELGSISPGEFIPVAEELKLIHRVDYKIAEKCIKSISYWSKKIKLSDEFRMSFNLSAGTIKRDDVVEIIEMLLKKYNVSGQLLEIEITESLFLKDTEKVITKLNTLKNLGIHISIDDFTAGHSTAGLLSILPVDTVKFDRSLILAFRDNDEKGKKVYEGLIKMIKSLELKTVAEGIEEKNELKFLREKGVDYGQGFLLGRPIKDKMFLKMIK